MDRWNKSNTPLHCLAHSLNPQYYSRECLGDEASGRVPPHRDMIISIERKNCLTRFFPKENERNKVVVEFANFSGCMGIYSSYDSLKVRGILDPNLVGNVWRFYSHIAVTCINVTWTTFIFFLLQKGLEHIFVYSLREKK